MANLLDKFLELEEHEEIKVNDSKPPTPVIKKPPKPAKEIFDNITFDEIANSSEFKRLVYLIQFGKTHRGKSEDLERKLIKRREEITIIKEIERGSKGAFNLVVKELKEKLAKQKVKIGE